MTIIQYELDLSPVNNVIISEDVINGIIKQQPKVPVTVMFQPKLCIGRVTQIHRNHGKLICSFEFNESIPIPDNSVELVLKAEFRVKDSHQYKENIIIDGAVLSGVGLFGKKPNELPGNQVEA